MKKGIVLSILLCAVVAAAGAQTVLDKPMAIVHLTSTQQIGLKDITRLIDLAQKQLGVSLSADQKKEILDNRIDTILLTQAAARDHVTVSDAEVNQTILQQRTSMGANITEDAFKRYLVSKMGMSWDDIFATTRDSLIAQRYVAFKKPDLAKATYAVTEQEISDFYEAQASQFVNPPMARFNYILMNTTSMTDAQKTAARQKMEGFARTIKSGGAAAFDQLVKNAVDDASYVAGDSNYIIKGDPNTALSFGKPFVDTVFAMPVGTFSGVLDIPIGECIIQITDKRGVKLLTLDDPLPGMMDPTKPGQKLTVREQIRQSLSQLKRANDQAKAKNDVAADLRKVAEVTYFDKNYPW